MQIFLYAFLKGLIYGMSIAAIPGPIFFLIVQRTLAEGALIGILCGLGALIADLIYMIMSVIGMSCVLDVLLSYKTSLTLLGAFSLFYLGFTTYRKQPHYNTVEIEDKRLFKAWLSTFLLTMTNPITIISYGIVFAGLGLEGQQATGNSLLAMVGGTVVGVLLVIGVLVGFLSIFHRKISPSALQLINKIAGMLLIIFGLLALLKGLKLV